MIPQWPFISQLGQDLFQTIRDINSAIYVARATADYERKAKSRQTYAAKKATANTESRPPTPPPTVRATRKRPALGPLVNAPVKRAAQPSASAITSTFRPQYKPRIRADAYDESVADENSVRPSLRRSTRGTG